VTRQVLLGFHKTVMLWARSSTKAVYKLHIELCLVLAQINSNMSVCVCVCVCVCGNS